MISSRCFNCSHPIQPETSYCCNECREDICMDCLREHKKYHFEEEEEEK